MDQGREAAKAKSSPLLHLIARLTELPGATVVVTASALIGLIVVASSGFHSRYVYTFETIASTITLILVFLVQHQQAREQLVTQRKLDELLAALPEADDSVVSLENASEEELAQRTDEHESVRATAPRTST